MGVENLKHTPVSICGSATSWKVATDFLHGKNIDPQGYAGTIPGYGAVSGFVFQDGNGVVELFFAGNYVSGLGNQVCVGPAETLIRPMIGYLAPGSPDAAEEDEEAEDASGKWTPDSQELTSNNLTLKPLNYDRFAGTALVAADGTLAAFYRGTNSPGDLCSCG